MTKCLQMALLLATARSSRHDLPDQNFRIPHVPGGHSRIGTNSGILIRDSGKSCLRERAVMRLTERVCGGYEVRVQVLHDPQEKARPCTWHLNATTQPSTVADMTLAAGA